MAKKKVNSVEESIKKILGYKEYLNSNYDNSLNSKSLDEFKTFIIENIELFNDLNFKESYIRNYLCASLLSLLMEKHGYDLNNWNYFFNDIYPNLKDKNTDFKDKKNIQGNILEVFVFHTINFVFDLAKENILALHVSGSGKESELINDYGVKVLPEETDKLIRKKITVSMKVRSGQEEKIWGDNDVIVISSPNEIEEAQAFCLLSCKTSLRERGYQSIFWALHSRIESIGKHAFVTLDKGSPSGNTELGLLKDKIKNRMVIESTFDRAYVLRNSKEVDRSFVIKDFKYLETDLLRWKKDFFGL